MPSSSSQPGHDTAEEGACGSLQRRDRARSVARRLVDDEVQGTGADLGGESEDHFEAPVAHMRVLQEQLIGGREVGRVSAEEPGVLVLSDLGEGCPLHGRQ